MTKARDLANAGTALGAVTATELAFVDGVTSAIQTQIDTKAPSSTAVTLTGTQTLTNKTLTSPVIASVVNNTLTSTTGDMIYASAANTPARLGIGSSAQVLTVAGGIPSWATASAGALTKINKTTFSAVSSVSTDSVFSSTYDNYLIVLNFTASAGNNFAYALRSGGTDSTGDYALQTLQSDDSTVNAARHASDTINFGVQGSTNYNSIVCTLISPNLAQRTNGFVSSLRENGSGNPNLFTNAIIVKNNTQFDGIKFIPGSGTITGYFTIYGYGK